MDMRGQVVEGVVGVLVEGGRLLAIRRAEGIRAAGFWCLPGGAIEPGESQEQAIVREMEEELGLAVRPVGKVWEWLRPDGLLLLHWWRVEPAGLRQDTTASVEQAGLHQGATASAAQVGLGHDVATSAAKAGGCVELRPNPAEVAEARFVSVDEFRGLEPVLESNLLFLEHYAKTCEPS